MLSFSTIKLFFNNGSLRIGYVSKDGESKKVESVLEGVAINSKINTSDKLMK